MSDQVQKSKVTPIDAAESDDEVTALEKPKGLARFRLDWFSLIMVFVLAAVIVLVVLALSGPVISNMFIITSGYL